MSNVIKLEVTEDQLRRALEHYDFSALRGSITNGESNVYGAIGEVVACDYLIKTGRRARIWNTFDCDLIVDGKKVDVKTKRTSVPPLQHFNCSIPGFNTRQKCDIYLFVRVSEDKKTAWILGYMQKDKFFKKSKFNRKGEPDPKFPAWEFRDDCYNLEISKLESL